MKFKPSLTGWVLLMGAMIFAMPATATASDVGSTILWYQQPGKNYMNDALAVGNSRLGCLVLGSTAAERIAINEDSLWTGDENPTGDYGKMGEYQVLGTLGIDLPGHENVTEYRRDLDIAHALAHVRYEVNGVHYSREIFASRPAGVIIIRLTADKPASYTGSISLIDSHKSKTETTHNRLSFAGALRNGLKYEAQLAVSAAGGKLADNGVNATFTGCDSVSLVLAAGTDYAMDYAQKYRGEAPTRVL